VTSCKVASCKVASCKVASCMGIKFQFFLVRAAVYLDGVKTCHFSRESYSQNRRVLYPAVL
jgi:hypothetical protein